jgi:hypothetical protein
MTVVSYPGVYIEEIPSGARAIEAAGTSTAAFVGLAERGPNDDAVRITSWDEYQKQFGGFLPNSFLAQSVYAFFNNGGRQCYIVRVMPDGADKAEVTVRNRAAVDKGVRFIATSKGVWGNLIFFTIDDGTNDPGNEFKLTIRRQEGPPLDPKTVPKEYEDLPVLEVHDNLSMDPDAPNYLVKVLERDSAIIRAQVLPENISLQPGLHRSGPNPEFPTTENNKLL